MISLPLFRREARRSILLLVIFAGILALYASVILTMYDPELGDSLAMMKDAMPELFAAFGMSDPGSTLTEFLANYLYGFLFLVLPLVLLILLTNRLVVGYLDQGTMAWLLSTPTPRWKIAATQAMSSARHSSWSMPGDFALSSPRSCTPASWPSGPSSA